MLPEVPKDNGYCVQFLAFLRQPTIEDFPGHSCQSKTRTPVFRNEQRRREHNTGDAKMDASLPQTERVKCTYKECDLQFESEKVMRFHKKNSAEHDYCCRCDEDFDCFEDYAQHKILKPDIHNKACRVCGDEFKSTSGLKRHIDLNHRLDQKLTCVGCQTSFYRAFLFIEHLEFGHCNVITSSEFQGYIVHKSLIMELLRNGPRLQRFEQKTSKYKAVADYEEEGGVELEGELLGDDEQMEEISFQALKPDTPPETPITTEGIPYPPLPSQAKIVRDMEEVTSDLGGVSLNGDDETETSIVVGSRMAATSSAHSMPGSSPSQNGCSTRDPSSIYNGSSIQNSSVLSTDLEPKAWGGHNGKSSSAVLFPNAKPTPTEFSVVTHDQAMEQEHGMNIMQTRFWDPMSTDWMPEKFFDAVLDQYYCPFVCEQTFPIAGDLNRHILKDHRVTRMKCPRCLKYFQSSTALMAHCESHGSRCQINKAEDFNIFLDRLSGGFLGVEEKVRPDHLNNGEVMVKNPDTGHMEMYRPVVARYLQYRVTTPPGWKKPVRPAAQFGGIPKTDPW
ncbi:hypothetical protein BDW02DRAFT_616512 [Decorospora gaudefroyi]|uniref:C2H2-type domain-containing protein n=1 Tax=Decorospora gaudefroyi TaxID=184978 RepID=A0A6A5KKQ2_9PLEO|nr:hypothetical protein BDW02DRAFT_616512 [Decorospora gaudefroyi]